MKPTDTQNKSRTSSLVLLFAVTLPLLSAIPSRLSAQEPDTERQSARMRRLNSPSRAARRAARTTPAPAPTPAPKPAPPAAPPAAPETQSADLQDEGVLKKYENLTGIPYKASSPGKLITFNLEQADLPDLVRLMSQLTGKRFIMPSKLRSIQATVFAPTKVSVAEAYQAFLSILELNGMALVPSGRYLKIVESGGIENKPIRLQTEGGDVPAGDTFFTRLERLEHIAAEDATEVIGRFKSADGNITAYAPSNMLIITDTGTNMNRIMRILKVIDIPRTNEYIWVEPVHYANATELAQRLTEIFEPTAGKPKSGQAKAPAKPQTNKKGGSSAPATIGSRAGESRITKILADERTNSLIILATDPAYARILDMLRHLDVPIEGEGRIHVHYLQHSDADEIAGTISALVGKGGAGKAAKGAKAATATEIFEGSIGITAHKPSNALVITSCAHDFASLRRTIDRLDVERRQVFIEAVIMELNVDRSTNLGLSFHTGVPGFPTDDSFGVVGFDSGRTVGGLLSSGNADLLTGLAVGVQGPEIETNTVGFSVPAFGVALRALAGSRDANILSTPHLIAMDNVEAEISVGENVPLQTSSQPSNLSSLAGLAGNQASTAGLSALAGLGYGGSVPRQDVGTTIKITPHINESDGIRLEISEEISSAGAPSDSGNLGVVSVQRTRAKTEVAVGDQQTVVIGGLMRDTATNAESKVPILGDIPLLGVLFRSTAKSKVKRNLVLFLTPYIIRSPDDLRAIYERKMRERQEFLDRYFVFGTEPYSPPIDYSRTRGLIGEMLIEITSLDGQRRLMEEAKSKPPLEHNKREPVGAAAESEDEDDDDGNESDGDGPAEPTEANADGPEPGQAHSQPFQQLGGEQQETIE